MENGTLTGAPGSGLPVGPGQTLIVPTNDLIYATAETAGTYFTRYEYFRGS